MGHGQAAAAGQAAPAPAAKSAADSVARRRLSRSGQGGSRGSAAAADRRVYVAMQLAGCARRATPRHRLAAVRQIARAVALGLAAERAAQPADHAQRLVVFFDADLELPDIVLLRPELAGGLLGSGRQARRETAGDRQQERENGSHVVPHPASPVEDNAGPRTPAIGAGNRLRASGVATPGLGMPVVRAASRRTIAGASVGGSPVEVPK